MTGYFGRPAPGSKAIWRTMERNLSQRAGEPGALWRGGRRRLASSLSPAARELSASPDGQTLA